MASATATRVQLRAELERLRGRVQELEQEHGARRRAEAALRESEGKHRRLFDTMAQGVVYQDARGTITSANPAAQRILGLSLDEMTGRFSTDPRWRAIHEDGSDFPGEEHPSMVALKTGKPVRDVLMGVFNPREEAQRWILVDSVPEFESGAERPCSVYTTFTDVTGRRRAEEALQESEERFRRLSDASSEAIVIHEDGCVIDANETCVRMFGHEIAELRGMKAADAFPEETLKTLQEKMRSGSEEPYELVIQRKDGSEFCAEVSGRTVSDDGRLLRVVAIRDVTERRQAQRALRESEERYRAIVEDHTELICRNSGDGTITFVNEAYCRYFQKSREQLVGHTFMPRVHPDDQARVKAHFASLSRQSPVSTHEHRILTPEGEVRWHQWTNRAIFSENGAIVEYQGAGRDITDHRRAEEALRFTQFAVDQAADGIHWLDREGHIIYVNEAGCRRLGYTCDELCTLSVPDIDPDYPADVWPEMWRRIKEQGSVSTESRHRRKDGSIFPVEITSNYLQFDGREYNCAIVRDITERKQAEYLVRVQRDLAVALGKTTDSHEVLRLCLRAGMEVSEMDCGGIYIVDPATGALDFLYHEGLSDESAAIVTHYEADSPNAQMVMAGVPVYTHYEQLELRKTKIEDDEGLKAIAVIPIKHAHRVVGCLNLASHTHEEVHQSVRNTVETIASQIGDAIANRQAEDALRQSEERMELALRGADLGTWDWNVQTGEVTFNGRWAEMLGYELDEIEPHLSTWETRVHPDDLPEIEQRAEAHLEARTDSYETEYRMRHKSGEWLWVLDRGRVIERDASGEPLRACGTHLDITERKRAEKRLLAEQAFSDTVVQSMPGLFYMFEKNSARFVRRNGNWAALTGYSEEDLERMTALEFFAEGDDRNLCAERMQEVYDRGSSWMENRLLTKSGEQIPYYFTGERVVVDGTTYLVGLGMDVSERTRAERALRESQRLLDDIINNSPSLIYVKDLDGRHILANRRFEEFLGLPAETVIGKADHELFPPALAEEFRSKDRRVASENLPRQFEEVVQNADGERRNFITQKFPLSDDDGTINAVCGISADITDHMRAEEALHAGEERLRVATDQLNGILWAVDTDLRFTLSKGRRLSAVGLRPDEAVGMTLFDYLQTTDPNHTKILQHRRALAGEMVEIETERDGLIYSSVLSPLRNAQGDVIGAVGLAMDITERKRAEETLREHEAMIRTLVETSQDWIWSIDLDGVHTYSNPAVEQMLGYPAEEWLGKRGPELMHADDRKKVAEMMPEWIEQKQGWRDLLLRWRHKDGSLRYLESSAVPILDNNDNLVGFRGVDRDITERRRAEQAVRDMAARERTLRCELDHRVRNSLASLITLADLTGRSCTDAASCAAAIRGRVQSMALVHTLLSAGGGQTSSLRALLYALNPTDCAGTVLPMGPPVTVNSAECHKLGIVINELLANSLKYGALGAAGGTVRVNWTTEPLDHGETRTVMHWEETGGPPIDAPPTPGVGTGLIEGLLSSDLRGRAELAYPREGAHHVLGLVLSAPETARAPGAE